MNGLTSLLCGCETRCVASGKCISWGSKCAVKYSDLGDVLKYTASKTFRDMYLSGDHVTTTKLPYVTAEGAGPGFKPRSEDRLS